MDVVVVEVGVAGTLVTPNLPTKILAFRGFDSSRTLILRGGILVFIENCSDVLSQRILVWRIERSWEKIAASVWRPQLRISIAVKRQSRDASNCVTSVSILHQSVEQL